MVVVAAMLPSLVTWLYFVALAEQSAPVQLGAYGSGKLIQFALPLVWVFGVRRAEWRLPGPTRFDVLSGLASGGAIVAAMFLLYAAWLQPAGFIAPAVAPIRDKVAGFGIDNAWKYAALGAFYALVHSLLEEYYWRWFVFGQLRRLTAFWPAAALSSLGFMAHHVLLLGTYFGYGSWLTWLLALSVAVGGAFWAWLYERSGSLWGPWLSHLLVDAGIFLVGWFVVRDFIAT